MPGREPRNPVATVAASLALGLLLSLTPGRGNGQAPPATPAPAPPTQPADPDLTAYLSRTPVTLLDWGMMRLRRDLEQAVKELRLDRGGESPAKLGTLFRFGDRRILLFASFSTPRAGRTEANCRESFQALREQLLVGAPGGSGNAEWYLARLFSSDFRGQNELPPGFGANLVDMVILEVTLRTPPSEAFGGGPGRIACAGRLDAATAYIVPPPQPPRPQG